MDFGPDHLQVFSRNKWSNGLASEKEFSQHETSKVLFINSL